MKSAWCWCIAAVFAVASVHAEVKSDLEYGRAGGESLRLDVGVPEGAGPFPVAILVHGGGWSGGDKQQDFKPLCARLNEAKFTWFSINYRLAPTNRWPAGFEDVQTAIRWVKAHAAEYKGNPGRIALVGYSAGGHLVCLSAVLARDDTRVQAVVGFAAPTDLVADTQRRGGLSKSLQDLLNRPLEVSPETREVLQDLSPINHVSAGLPPVLLVQGTEDKSVPYDQSIKFQAALREHRVDCKLVTMKGAPHRIADWVKFDADYPKETVDWLVSALGRDVKPPPSK